MAEIGAVLLAAGASQRFGADNKLLANIEGRPLIRRAAEEIMHSGAEVLVVTGCDHLLIEKDLDGLPLRFAHNPSWTRGMDSSIAVGVMALGSQALGAFIVPGDMPFLTSALLKHLMTAFSESRGASIVYPTTLAGEQRNPALWPRRFFPLLASLSGPGAKSFGNTGIGSLPIHSDRGYTNSEITLRCGKDSLPDGRICIYPSRPPYDRSMVTA
jgi:molybdenum cofactor cytidylyltransferase